MFKIIDTDNLITDYVETGKYTAEIQPVSYDGEYGEEVGITKKEAYKAMCGMLSIAGPRTLSAANEKLQIVTATLYLS